MPAVERSRVANAESRPLASLVMKKIGVPVPCEFPMLNELHAAHISFPLQNGNVKNH